MFQVFLHFWRSFCGCALQLLLLIRETIVPVIICSSLIALLGITLVSTKKFQISKTHQHASQGEENASSVVRMHLQAGVPPVLASLR